MDSIKQAVFLCGGIGSRLMPITKNVPKPMVLVNEKPFLFYLLKQLSDFGIKRFLLLTGYLGEKISTYFGDGRQWGWEISYSHGPIEWDTARRIWESRTLLDDFFLLTYSDNFVQLKLDELYSRWKKNSSTLTLHLFEKKGGNVSISNDMNILYEPRDEINGSLNFVELGYMIANKKKLMNEMRSIDGFPNICFSSVIGDLSKRKMVSGVVVKDQYHSVSDPKRLNLARQYLKLKKIILLDRDGTINKKAERGKYITSWNEFEFIDKNIEGLKELASYGFEFIVITNQAGISTNEIDQDKLNQIHEKMVSYLNCLNIKIIKIFVSTDHWRSNCFRRKPNPGMLFEASKEFHFRLDQTFFIGDDKRDCFAAHNAGCGSLLLTETYEGVLPKTDYHSNYITGLVPFILNKFSELERIY